MKSVIMLASAALGLSASVGPSEPPASPPKPIRLAQNTTCFKTGENQPPGSMTKICYYDCLGSPVAITISSVQLCPLSIKR